MTWKSAFGRSAIVVVLAITAHSLITYGNTVPSEQSTKVPPEQSAKEYASSLGMTLRGVPVCAYRSGMADYVSCTLNVADGDSSHLVPVQCASDSSSVATRRGCRLAVASSQ